LVDVNLFDVYAGENIESGKKSVALNLSYQSVEETLSDDQVNAQGSEVLAVMQTKFSATQR
jgi:phenylalanyl-tRNA synthetase beta chain